jgi:hypothetical protein
MLFREIIPVCSKNSRKHIDTLREGSEEIFSVKIRDRCDYKCILKRLNFNPKIRIYKTIIFLMVLYGCETWSLTVREEHRLRVFGNRVLRRIFGQNRDEVTGGWNTCIITSFITFTFRQI